jgi:phosphatidylethanolamine/phosphatidyl-N-methylethanolamine N-methyltransferase
MPQKRTLLQEINNLPPGKLLEIGVGNGKHLPLYKKHEITGIDTSFSMLEIAKKQAGSSIELLQMNGESLLFQDQTFDYVILSHVIAVVDNPDTLLAETYRVLKPHGQIFILNHFTPTNWLRHIDNSVQMVSKLFHFRSVFHINSLTTIKKFTLLKEISFGRLSYFKLLIYGKS